MRRELPTGFKLAYTAFVAVLVPVYTIEHGLANFLWFSNVALLGGLVAAWTESRRLATMLLVSVGLLEMGWLIDFTGGVLRGGEAMFGLVDYMFDPTTPLAVRLLSLYHVPLPFVLFWMAWRLHYDPVAWRAWIPAGVTILLVTFLVVDERQNVNWVYGGAGEGQDLVPEWVWLGIVMALCSFAWWLTHVVALRIYRRFGRVYG